MNEPPDYGQEQPEAEWITCEHCKGEGCDKCCNGEVLNEDLSEYEQMMALDRRNKY